MVSSTDELERGYREEATRIRAGLAARLGDVGLAVELVHDAFLEAVQHWRTAGVPQNPGAWLAVTAGRMAMDRLRLAQAGQDSLAQLAERHAILAERRGREQDEELLGLVFACCHPSLPRQSQIALTLRAACGLTAAEIASAFGTRDQAVARRLNQARASLRRAGSAVTVPGPGQLPARLPEVLAVVHLMFTEGCLPAATQPPAAGAPSAAQARHDLAVHAVALSRLLHRLLPGEPEVLGLLALLLLLQSQAGTRFGRRASEPPDQQLTEEAIALLGQATAMCRSGPYQLQAAIAGLHADAACYGQADWWQIRLLYDRLDQLTPSPLVRLHRAVATQFTVGPQEALAEVEPLAAEMDGYRLFHTVRAGLLEAVGRSSDALWAAERAQALAENPPERDLLSRHLPL